MNHQQDNILGILKESGRGMNCEELIGRLQMNPMIAMPVIQELIRQHKVTSEDGILSIKK